MSRSHRTNNIKKMAKKHLKEDPNKHLERKSPDDEFQFYATVTQILGNGRVHIKSLETAMNEDMIGKIRGKMRRSRKQFVHLNDVVLVSKRDFSDKTCDILCVYNEDEKRELIRCNDIKNLHLLNNDIAGPSVQNTDQHGNEIEDVFNFEEI